MYLTPFSYVCTLLVVPPPSCLSLKYHISSPNELRRSLIHFGRVDGEWFTIIPSREGGRKIRAPTIAITQLGSCIRKMKHTVCTCSSYLSISSAFDHDDRAYLIILTSVGISVNNGVDDEGLFHFSLSQ